jgi:hypothetical protein
MTTGRRCYRTELVRWRFGVPAPFNLLFGLSYRDVEELLADADWLARSSSRRRSSAKNCSR